MHGYLQLYMYTNSTVRLGQNVYNTATYCILASAEPAADQLGMQNAVWLPWNGLSCFA